MNASAVGFALLLLGVVLLLGKVIRVKGRWSQRLFLPSSIIAGFLALLLGPDALGKGAEALGVGWLEGGAFNESTLDVWTALPELLISVVFATLFLGKRLPNPIRAAKLVGPQVSVGVTFAAGQYVVGLLLAVLVLAPLFGISPMVGALIEMGFEGGHGTAAGMAPVLKELDFAEGGDLALGLATIGLVSGILIGVAVINWGVRTGRTAVLTGSAEQSVDEAKGLFRKDEQFPAAMMTTRPASVEPLAIHFAVVAVAIVLGLLLLTGLQQLEQLLWADTVELLAFVPLFPLAMLGGVAVQAFLDRTGNTEIIDERMMLRIQGFALDLLIVSALATLSLTAIAENLGPFLLLAGAGILFNVAVLLLVVPRSIPEYWFERGLGDFGQSMGVTATGLILMRIVDPDAETPAFEAFGYKQLLLEPFFGGGLITATAVPLVYQFGPWPLLIAMSVLLVVSAVIGMAYFGRQPWSTDEPAQQKT